MNQPSITCPRCSATSHDPTDVQEGYCGRCHDWTTPKTTAPPPAGCFRFPPVVRVGDRVELAPRVIFTVTDAGRAADGPPTSPGRDNPKG